ncbi:MAG: S24/S26 family peptidase [Thermoanaerobaculia bacterium]
MTAVFEALRSLAREGPVEVRVRGDCMAPLFADGGRVRVAGARFYAPGDVVVFRATDGRLVAHRLLGYRYRPRAGGLALVTRGDSCPVHDAPVPLAAVLGRVEAARPTAAVRVRSLLRFLGLAGLALRRRWRQWRQGR